MTKYFFFFAAIAFSTVKVSAELRILPSAFTLEGKEARQQVLVLEESSGHFTGILSGVALESSNPNVAQVDEDGIVTPTGNGSATIMVETPEGRAEATVTVRDFDEPFDWSFTRHVLPVLSKSGCNMGGCHGALAGKGGFRLSLRGYDPPGDHYHITREARGRRIELADPARSLILTKPTLAVKHKGGKRLDPRSRDYRILAEWIRNGASAPQPGEADLERLEVFPKVATLQPGDTMRLVVRAHYADGSSGDVTSWARFSSADETVAEVDEDGLVTVIGHGEGAVTAWFSSRIVMARIVSPYDNAISNEVYAEIPRRNFIDEAVLDQLQALRLKPSRKTNDAEFVRRVFLDTIGVLPTPEETQAFLEDAEAGKRERLIDHLLHREEFVDYWAYRFSDMFLVNGQLLRPQAVKTYYEWIRGHVAANTPWDELARELVTAKGDSLKNGATNFYAVHQDPETMAENVSQTFLSLSINCAKCHNHPLEKWTNDQYYAFANLFSRVRAKGWGGDPRSGDGARTVYVEPRGDLIQPRTGRAQTPAPLDGEPLDPDATGDRREHLADWLTSPDNPYFARSIANRIWAAFFGRGIVDPVDDLRESNPASNEALLNDLADYLVANHYDLKALMRAILVSETYQRSSEALDENRDDLRHFSRYYPRRLMAEVLHDAIVAITEVPADFETITLTDGSTEKTSFYPEGTRSLELYDSAVSSYFLRTFGRNERAISCECERSNVPSMVQVLHLANGETINDNLRQSGGIVDRLLNKDLDVDSLIRQAYLRCLSRPPDARELEGFRAIMEPAQGEEKRLVLEDLFWALMSSREFLFQH